MLRDSIRLLPAAVFTVLSILAPAAPAAAQSLAEPDTWTVTPFLSSSIDVGMPRPGEFGNPDLDNSVGIGAAIGYDLTHNVGFEGEVSHLFDTAGSTDAVDWAVSNFSVNGIYHFDVKRVTPYATFGIGVARSSFDRKGGGGNELERELSSTEVAVNFGGGVKYPLNRRWVVRGDLRRFQANDQAPDFWRLYGGVTITIAGR